jgi:glycosyltransferase involved in cell wall biosynthesis
VIELSVIICTHNPRRDYLRQVLDALRNQSLSKDRWELLIVDNASQKTLAEEWDLTWHPHARHVREDHLGLVFARVRGFHESIGEIIVYLDDDNVLDVNYLQYAQQRHAEDPSLGACGGKLIGEFETAPPAWFDQISVNLGLNDQGPEAKYFSWVGLEYSQRKHPHGAPSGAGIAVKRAAYQLYIDAFAADPIRHRLGRRGRGLSSGEDNDIVLTLMSNGYRLAYIPHLAIRHLIPSRRVNPSYLASLGYAGVRSWYLVHYIHGITEVQPIPPWTIPHRKLLAFWRRRAWRTWPQFIAWRQECGWLDGRADVYRIKRDRVELDFGVGSPTPAIFHVDAEGQSKSGLNVSANYDLSRTASD